jgi:hypothetical protein
VQFVSFWVVSGETVPGALVKAEKLGNGIQEVDELGEKKPVANDGNLT